MSQKREALPVCLTRNLINNACLLLYPFQSMTMVSVSLLFPFSGDLSLATVSQHRHRAGVMISDA